MIHSLVPFQTRLIDWYRRQRRDLPWRPPLESAAGALPDPYFVLVSELMLQQTQVATVIPYFHRFTKKFPTLAALALADEQEVLRLWQGLGYYSRGRNLLKAAKVVMAEYDGRLPSDVSSLLELPGIGRYTAGAIASIAHGKSAPILDGNVIRVLCRLDVIRTDPRETTTRALLWKRAEHILPAKHAGDFNSALMELGALICTPRSPQCLLCPVRAHCEAQAAGVAEQIPPPKKAKTIPINERWTFCIRRQTDYGVEWLFEQRPAAGRWASLWQFVTVPAATKPPTTRTVRSLLPVAVTGIRPLGEVTHALTHRRYRFEVFLCDATTPSKSLPAIPPRQWLPLDRIERIPLSKPQLQIAEMLNEVC